ncbi:KLH24-like protein [Mya arenaria]|uniref:KLH24-like protein n=1 Tax=Mya arenaria TaxID=6604 RepID=A0ABY7ETL0_MYAAR|nr:kelch-like protein 24 [Mya arenaria]WAR13310.1 KLH24-like protein [Mya arenaria]
MTSPVQDWKESTATCLQTGIFKSYTAGLYTDVEIQVEKKTFKSHKVILSAFSDYFHAMFSSGMKESQNNVVCIKDISSIIFENVLSFAYSGEDCVTIENAEDLLRASVLLQIRCLQSRCESFLLEQTTAENCIGIWRLAQSLNCEKLKETSWEFILKEFEVISQLDEFLGLDKEELISIICNDNLTVTNEENVCDAVFRWLERDESRLSYLADVFEELRLQLVSLQYLLEKVDFNPAVRNSETCTKLVKHALDYHLYPERREMYNVPLRNGNKVEVIVLIGKTPQGREQKLIEVYCYSPSDCRWFTMPPLPSNIGRYFSCCVYGDYIYVSGGTERPIACLKLHIGRRDWIHCRSMNFGRLRHAMVAERSSVYVVGGFDPITDVTYHSIEKYDIAQETWKEIGELTSAVDALSAAAYKGKIYVFGGWLKDCDHAACVQCFDTATNECTIIDCLPDPAKFSRCVQSLDGCVYIMYPTGEVVRYKIGTMEAEKFAKISGFKRYNFGLTMFHDKLFAFGGESDDPTVEEGTELCRNLFELDLTSRTSKMYSDLMPNPFESYGSVRVVMNRDFLIAYKKELGPKQ